MNLAHRCSCQARLTFTRYLARYTGVVDSICFLPPFRRVVCTFWGHAKLTY